MKLAIATDHRGRKLKLEIIEKLSSEFEILDCSKENYDTDDYPDFAFAVCHEVVKNRADFGVLICGTGIGMSIAANKVKGVRCALVHDVNEARLAKEHNGANVLAFGSYMGCDNICECIKEYAKSQILLDKHERRREKIIKYEMGEYNEL